MAKTELTSQEREKATILTQAIEGTITNHQAATQLHISIRQVQRAKAAIRKHGITAVVHGLKGKEGNHRIPEEIKQQAVQIIQERYADFKPSFATEKLAENHAISISYGTTRYWMIESGLWKSHKQKQSEYHTWRERKEYFGELEQFDGSYHLWFEERLLDGEGNPQEVCLLASIDDATGKITRAEFALNEGIHAVFTFWTGYVTSNGKPLKVYLDKFSTYKINHKNAVDNTEALTQFQTAMKLLKVELIPANSPQAKGRIERLFETLQDRLVKELRLANMNTIEEGNRFLQEVFIPQFNTKFGVQARKSGDVHRVLTKEEKMSLESIFSIKSKRRVNNDFTIQFKNHFYQLKEIQPVTVRSKERVEVQEWLDGSIHFVIKGKKLNYFILPERPQKVSSQPVILTSHPLNWKPPVNHPWRLYKQKI